MKLRFLVPLAFTFLGLIFTQHSYESHVVDKAEWKAVVVEEGETISELVQEMNPEAGFFKERALRYAVYQYPENDTHFLQGTFVVRQDRLLFIPVY